MTVNLYTYTTAKAAKNKIVGFGYVLECVINEKPVTISKTGTFQEVGKNEAEIKVLNEALQRIKLGNSVNLFTQSSFVAAVLKGWLKEWIKTGHNSKGEPIAEIYKETALLLVGRNTSVFEGEHEYLKWLQSEAEREKSNAIHTG